MSDYSIAQLDFEDGVDASRRQELEKAIENKGFKVRDGEVIDLEEMRKDAFGDHPVAVFGRMLGDGVKAFKKAIQGETDAEE